MSQRLITTFNLLFFSIFFSFFLAVISNDYCTLPKDCKLQNFTCVFDRRQCECLLGYKLNKTNHCVQVQCPLNEGLSCSELFPHTECVGGRCKCAPSYEGAYIYDETSNTCLIPPNRTKELLIIIIPIVVGVLIIAAIIGVFVWKYKRTKKENQKTFHFRSDDDGALAMQSMGNNIDAQQTSLNDHQMVLNSDASFSPVQNHQSTQQQTEYSAPVDFPPPYSVEDYGGPSTSFANPNPAALEVEHQQLVQTGQLQTPEDSSPYSPIASSKLTVL